MDLRPLGLYGSGGFESGYEVFVGSGNGRNKHSSSPALSLRPRCNAEKRNNGDKNNPYKKRILSSKINAYWNTLFGFAHFLDF
ncbi:hypothetical protein AMTRI_Chr08g206880 [Amborella trichopoda]